MTGGQPSPGLGESEAALRPATRRAPGMTDVARLAGVSHQTVSRVLNDHPNVREQTRLRVRAAMEQLGYRPNRAARALVTGRSHVVGIVAQNTALYRPTAVLAAIERAVSADGFAVGIASVPVLDRPSIIDAVARLLDQRVAGIVVIAPVVSANEALDDVPDDVAMVVIDGDPARPSRLVTVDQRLGARLATRCLLAAGHETVWHVSGPADWFDSAGRVESWRQEMWIRGLEALDKPLLHLHTQANQALPWDSLDMDFMNLNQAAHGDREFGYIQTRRAPAARRRTAT
nr:LacI family DNA-binding transcriptional regulator [Pseudofrankia sp. DC12]